MALGYMFMVLKRDNFSIMKQPLKKRFLIGFALLSTVALAVAFITTEPATIGPKQAVVLIIRHADKADDGPGLSEQGTTRAQKYAEFFQSMKINDAPLKLDAIYAAADSKASMRPRLTVEPLAAALKLPVNTTFANRRPQELANALKQLRAGQQSLVCWHHGNMPALLEALGVNPDMLLRKGKWQEPVYNWVLQLTFDKDGKLIPGGFKKLNGPSFPSDALINQGR